MTEKTDLTKSVLDRHSTRNLISYSRGFDDHEQFQELSENLLYSGWESAVRYIEVDDNIFIGNKHDDARRHFKREGYYPPFIEKKKYGRQYYVTHLKMPPEEEHRIRIDAGSLMTSPNRTKFGDTLFQIAFNHPNKLTPRLTHIYQNSFDGDDYYHSCIEFQAVKPIFYEATKNPVRIKLLDATASQEPQELNTLSANQGRGLEIPSLLEQIRGKFGLLGQLEIEFTPQAKRTMIRFNIQSARTIKTFLDAIEYCSGLLWEWVNTNKILLLPGPEFGKISRTYIYEGENEQ